MEQSTLYLAVTFGFILLFVHYFSDKLVEHKKHHKQIISFGAGVSLAYIFLILLPELYKGIDYAGQFIFVVVLSGTLLFHYAEKYIYQHAKKAVRLKELRAVHTLAFFSYHFMIGIVLVDFLRINITSGVLLMIPVTTFTAVGLASMKRIHFKVTQKPILKILLASSTLMGILISLFLVFPKKIFYILLAFIMGALLYELLRKNIPKKRSEDTTFFMIGALLYALIIMLIWLIV